MTTEQDKAEGNAEVSEHGGAAPESTAAAEESAQAEVARIREQLLRTAADFDNFRKRSRREIEDARFRGREELLRDFLPVFDNLERAVAHAEQAADAKAVADGVRMVLRQFVDTLGKVGIERIESVGKPFDPNFHDAFQQMETTEHAPGTVIAELQPGYLMGDRLVRPAMVMVAKASSAPANADGSPSDASDGQ